MTYDCIGVLQKTNKSHIKTWPLSQFLFNGLSTDTQASHEFELYVYLFGKGTFIPFDRLPSNSYLNILYQRSKYTLSWNCQLGWRCIQA